MGRRLLIILLVCLPLCTVINGAYAVEDPVFDSQLSAALTKTLADVKEILDTKNISASLYISDRCYWEGATGVTRQNPDIPVHSDMIYGFGSITKTFVAGIILQLAEEKKLSLDDPIGKWLPRYPNINYSISIRQLLNHGSGLGGYYGSKRFWAQIENEPDREWLPEDTLKYLRPPQEPGSAPPRYSNTNYTLLGMIIEATTGNSFEDELQSRITGPLQLDNTYLPKKNFDHKRWADSTRLYTALFSSVWAGGAIASTSKDIAKWSHALYSSSFLQPSSLDSMLVTEPRRIAQIVIPMGLGVWKAEVHGRVAWGHGGRFKPFLSATFYVPDLDLSVAHSFNWSEGASQLIPVNHLLQTYIDNRPDDISKCFDS